MILPGNAPLTIVQGATFNPYWIMSTKTGNTTTVVNLTGYTARMVVRNDVDDPDELLILTTENGGITITGSEGKIALNASSTATAALDFGVGVYNLDITKDGVTDRILQGKVTLDPWTNYP